MKVKVTATDSFTHYRWSPAKGDSAHLPEHEAKELEGKGLVLIEADDPPTGETDSQTDDLLGEAKAAPALENKMETAPENKADAKPKKK
jgi:hypothetical protein